MGQYASTSTKTGKKGLILICYFELNLHPWKKRSRSPSESYYAIFNTPFVTNFGARRNISASPYLLDSHKDNPMNLLIGHNEGAASFKYFQNSWDCLCEYVNPRDKEMLRLGMGFN